MPISRNHIILSSCIIVSSFVLYKADAGAIKPYIGNWAKLEGRVFKEENDYSY
jgi:hypothetical protein